MIFELLSAIFFLVITNLGTADKFCFDKGNYTSNSVYKSNLEALLPSLSSSVDDNGFYNASTGNEPDAVYANVLCRGDIQLDACRSCIDNATVEIAKSCPDYRQAVQYNELCTLRYSSESMFRVLMPSDTQVAGWSQQNVSSPEQFMAGLDILVNVLRSQASSGGSLRKVAAGNTTTDIFQNIFSLVQCTPDLSSEDCSSCLVASSGNIPKFCDGRRGCRVQQPNCILRYEDVPFYNETRLRELQALGTTPSTSTSTSTPSGKKDASKTRTIVIIVVSIIACLILAVGAGFLLKNKMPIENLEYSVQGIHIVESLQYDFCEIKAATDDFSDANKLGQGGFGAVYKGILSNGDEIAVKRLSMDSKQGDVEFKNEVLLVAKLQHRNLVRLLGFCIEGNERLLIYEFIKNASLDKFIFDPRKRSDLDSEIRYKIIGGIAKGLLYLHEESRLKIIHRDLKASNILLDADMNPKISDFGTARLFLGDETQVNTNMIVGTRGYMAPEYAMYGDLSVKSDVFSFGVLVLEIVSGQRNQSNQNGREDMENLLSLAWKSWRQRMSENVIDPVLRTTSWRSSLDDMVRCIHIGLLCVQDNPVDRPTMASVVVMLSSFTVSLPIPLETTHFTIHGYNSGNANFQRSDLNDEAFTSKSSSLNRSTQSSESSKNKGSSKNDMSITELYPR